ncbi:Ribosomal protein S18 acetylase RimI [Microbacterium sp. ru370.1]|uniref:GNAT family N-acetyltransferase n=1 Tax=unclassified Microbacterium TaxID=2609290 RepID=UPI00088F1252|nr:MULTISPECIES: GNAT family N-acetyltransferase [unclassified Microbacterium]SDO73002.1 Ribosomal protein S18 acetylase RimI [Microbacterium sp. ru370.1]SIT87723.1 Ribosomal protein S18 acetylase RimI [Microbacterium sp. RU1D]
MFTLRPTQEDDWRRLRAFRIENATDDPISWTATVEETLRIPEDGWRMRARRGAQPDTTSIVATDDGSGRWLGMMCAQLGDAQGPEPVLTGVYVTPDARGREKGVTDALFDAILRWAGSSGTVLRLWVAESAAPARRYYARKGFAPTGRVDDLRVLGRAPQPDDGGLLEMSRVLPGRAARPREDRSSRASGLA